MVDLFVPLFHPTETLAICDFLQLRGENVIHASLEAIEDDGKIWTWSGGGNGCVDLVKRAERTWAFLAT